MKIEEALPFLREGKGITRTCWKKGFYTALDEYGLLIRKRAETHAFLGSDHFLWDCMKYDDWEVIDEI